MALKKYEFIPIFRKDSTYKKEQWEEVFTRIALLYQK